MTLAQPESSSSSAPVQMRSFLPSCSPSPATGSDRMRVRALEWGNGDHGHGQRWQSRRTWGATEEAGKMHPETLSCSAAPPPSSETLSCSASFRPALLGRVLLRCRRRPSCCRRLPCTAASQRRPRGGQPPPSTPPPLSAPPPSFVRAPIGPVPVGGLGCAPLGAGMLRKCVGEGRRERRQVRGCRMGDWLLFSI
jgi:hypothetical protein